jgi:hypothetical protein
MNWIRVGNIRINLEHVTHIEELEEWPMWLNPDEARAGGEIKPYVAVYLNTTDEDGQPIYLVFKGQDRERFNHAFDLTGVRVTGF